MSNALRFLEPITLHSKPFVSIRLVCHEQVNSCLEHFLSFHSVFVPKKYILHFFKRTSAIRNLLSSESIANSKETTKVEIRNCTKLIFFGEKKFSK